MRRAHALRSRAPRGSARDAALRARARVFAVRCDRELAPRRVIGTAAISVRRNRAW